MRSTVSRGTLSPRTHLHSYLEKQITFPLVTKRPLGNANQEAPASCPPPTNPEPTMGRSRYRPIDTRPHFITCTIVQWLTLFSQPKLVAEVLSTFPFLQSQNRLTLHAYVIMENHLHLIASASQLSREMQSFKSFSAKQIVRSLEQSHQSFWLDQLRFHKRSDKVQSTYQVWQEGFHPQMICDAEMLRQKLDYVHNNPVRRGYVDDPCHWRYSSARNYAGQRGILDVEILEI